MVLPVFDESLGVLTAGEYAGDGEYWFSLVVLSKGSIRLVP